MQRTELRSSLGRVCSFRFAEAGTKAAAAASSSHPDGTAQNAAAAIAAATSSTEPATVSYQDLKYVALQYGLPFIGFGFVDNAIMILAGDYIDLTLGVSLGISSMAAAGIGNTISDIAGLGLGNVVEDLCARLGLPTPVLTPEQLMLKQTRFAKVVGSSIGITIGCLLGMTPLLFLETREDHAKNKKQDVGSGGARSATIDIHAV
uniref:Transmembrane protein 65 n=1 Tax=Globisporangium ultimum (strain ATCC 200006 / CBS 805.95 / DAOM BR144) TaxID=431595 RepID=K3WR93_GLOUD